MVTIIMSTSLLMVALKALTIMLTLGPLLCTVSLDLKNPANNCNPYLVWSSTLSSGTSYYRGNLNNGSFTLNSGDYTRAYGVRCVLDLKFL